MYLFLRRRLPRERNRGRADHAPFDCLASRANTAAMNAHLDEISTQVEPGSHAVLIIDGAGWHTTKSLKVPDNVSLLRLPPIAQNSTHRRISGSS